MKLRVSEEAELGGLDLDQFFDEAIGDWGVVGSDVVHGLPGTSSSAGGSSEEVQTPVLKIGLGEDVIAKQA